MKQGLNKNVVEKDKLIIEIRFPGLDEKPMPFLTEKQRQDYGKGLKKIGRLAKQDIKYLLSKKD